VTVSGVGCITAGRQLNPDLPPYLPQIPPEPRVSCCDRHSYSLRLGERRFMAFAGKFGIIIPKTPPYDHEQ